MPGRRLAPPLHLLPRVRHRRRLPPRRSLRLGLLLAACDLHLPGLVHEATHLVGVQHDHGRLQLVQQRVHLRLLALLLRLVGVGHIRVVVGLPGPGHLCRGKEAVATREQSRGRGSSGVWALGVRCPALCRRAQARHLTACPLAARHHQGGEAAQSLLRPRGTVCATCFGCYRCGGGLQPQGGLLGACVGVPTPLSHSPPHAPGGRPCRRCGPRPGCPRTGRSARSRLPWRPPPPGGSHTAPSPWRPARLTRPARAGRRSPPACPAG